MKKRVIVAFSLIVVTVTFLGCGGSGLGIILFQDNFDSGIWSKNWGLEKGANSVDAVRVVSNQSGSGRAVRFELHKTDDLIHSGKRAELSLPNDPQYAERWYAFSIYLPLDYERDTSEEILAQWHGWPDENLGETWMSPPLALLTGTEHWRINRLWDANPVSSNDLVKTNYTREYIDLGPYASDRGKWTNWVFHIKWGWLPEHNAKLEVYKNGTKVVDRNGLPNTTNDVRGPYFKMGIYKWDWNNCCLPDGTDPTLEIVNKYGKPMLNEDGTLKLRYLADERVVFFDSVKIGDEDSRLIDVTP